jgi:hypothetical protein
MTMANKTYADLPNYGQAYPDDIENPKVGEIVYIKDEWRADYEPRDDRYVITNVNEESRRCYIVCLDSKMILKPQNLVAFSMIERR